MTVGEPDRVNGDVTTDPIEHAQLGSEVNGHKLLTSFIMFIGAFR